MQYLPSNRQSICINLALEKNKALNSTWQYIEPMVMWSNFILTNHLGVTVVWIWLNSNSTYII